MGRKDKDVDMTVKIVEGHPHPALSASPDHGTYLVGIDQAMRRLTIDMAKFALPFRGDFVYSYTRNESTAGGGQIISHDLEPWVAMIEAMRRARTDTTYAFPRIPFNREGADHRYKEPLIIQTLADAEALYAVWVEWELRCNAVMNRLWDIVRGHLVQLRAAQATVPEGDIDAQVAVQIMEYNLSVEAGKFVALKQYIKHFNDPNLIHAVVPLEGLTLTAIVSRAGAHDWGVALSKSKGGACTLKLRNVVASDGLTEIPAANIDVLTTKEYALTSANARSASLRLKLTGIEGAGTWYAYYDCIHPDGPQSRAEVKVELVEPAPEPESEE